MNKACDKDLTTADEKETFNSFIDSINKNNKIAQFEDLYDEYIKNKDLDKGEAYYSCFEETMNKEWVYEQFSSATFKGINGKCDKKFSDI